MPNKKHERAFFVGMSLLLSAAVVLGFWWTYFGAGLMKAPLPSRLVHFHGAAFSLWMVLFVVQIGLISARRTKVHRKLGLAGMGLAAVMVVLVVLTATAFMRRNLDRTVSASTPSSVAVSDVRAFYVVQLSDAAVFGLLMLFAYRMRSQPDAHKRLVLLATISLMRPAVSRILIHFDRALNTPGRHDWLLFWVVGAFASLLVAYDLFSLRRIHRATLWATVCVALVYTVRGPIGSTAVWHRFASFMADKG